MSLIETTSIPCWPNSVYLAYASIIEHEDVSFLSKIELNELNSLANPQRRNEFVSGRKLLRDSVYQIRTNTPVITVDKDDMGKPFGICNGEVMHISFSHTKGHVFCAFSDSIDIGVDIESMTRSVHKGLLDRILNQQEQDLLNDYSAIQLWTIKEAAVKKKGIGIRIDLKQVQVSKSMRVLFEDDSRVQFCNFETLGYSVSLAY